MQKITKNLPGIPNGAKQKVFIADCDNSNPKKLSFISKRWSSKYCVSFFK
tara:strand:+ start:169 stop:318 length:150 start_codon:yes stop_codon:yes gene_type:complete